MNQVIPIKAFNDNYIWLIVNEKNNNVACIDPGDYKPVYEYLTEYQLNLTHILLTHHHHDHIGGVKALKDISHAKVYGPPSIPLVTNPILNEAEVVSIPELNESFHILTLPGHTNDHIAYYDDKWLFCGDTLFSMGCGRVFEGTMQQMFDSLQKLKALPDELLVFCAHEYTLANITFAKSLDPTNADITDFETAILIHLEQGKPSLPSKLKTEKNLNPFLQVKTVKEFEYIRLQKDNF